jgi:hypothetical protein
MSEINDGGAAFPHAGTPHPTDPMKAAVGLSIRDYFASQAIGGMLASQYVSEHAGLYKTDAGMVEGLALRSYQIADAMIAAREVKE